MVSLSNTTSSIVLLIEKMYVSDCGFLSIVLSILIILSLLFFLWIVLDLRFLKSEVLKVIIKVLSFACFADTFFFYRLSIYTLYILYTYYCLPTGDVQKGLCKSTKIPWTQRLSFDQHGVWQLHFPACCCVTGREWLLHSTHVLLCATSSR